MRPVGKPSLVASFDNLQIQWTKYRSRLEREIRILVVEDDAGVRKVLDRLLYRNRISSRAIDNAAHVLDLVKREHYSLVLVADHFPQLKRMELVQQLHLAFPEVDVVISSPTPTLELLQQAFLFGILDVISTPLRQPQRVGERLKDAVRRNVDRRMRTYALRQLREELKRFDGELRMRTTTQLEQRLAGLKRWMGAFNAVLVVEGQDRDLRFLGENLLVAGLRVETADRFADALKRLAEGPIHLLVLEAPAGSEPARLLESVREVDPSVELMIVSRRPDAVQVSEALHRRVAAYLPWPPDTPDQPIPMVHQILRRSRADRLMDNLLAALFWETQSATAASPEENFEAFRELVGMCRLPMSTEIHQPSAEAADAADAMDYLEQVLDHILNPDAELPQLRTAEDQGQAADEVAADEGQERRAFVRVMENQFVRFRKLDRTTNTVAYLGDLSEGGIFIRTAELLTQGTPVEVDVNVEHEGQGYLVRCKGEVAWVARTGQRSPLGTGFGVRFIDPPGDVMILLQRVVHTRMGGD